ncbi:hypothetical protein BCL57_002868 [Agromyces flavus]|uniref:Uncharacterized protein n=1 Tax=Agromyces flavus TaxID=589382 RepID=A0A1H1M168_9MICO|nr:hypothetical protein [Agromyces flavus]GGI48068.1 hypothetical protein GCM10010932_27560 [Agromyces flavus]SDR80533.1 hypothetical protein SAMN04489721_0322 [Agromyces flavus]
MSSRADAAARRLLVVADADSYVKWGAALASTLGPEWTARLVVIASPVQPSARQLRHALAGTRFEPAEVLTIPLEPRGGAGGLDDELDGFDPHAVLLALRGPFVRVVAPRLNRRPNRPAILSGFPGLTIPAVPKAVVYREQTDLIVLHSRREVRDFRANADDLGVDPMFGLATLPFLAGEAGDRAAATDIVFAAQAKVPAERDDRLELLAALAELARRRAPHRVVVKVRARRGEAQTHAEEHDYADLLAELHDAPANLVVEDGPMADQLDRAAALVTVSSTAALEAVARDLPALLVDDFGVSPAMINTVFEGAGLFGSTTDLVAGRFRHADPGWLADNYFHEPDADDWAGRLEALVSAREIVPLPPLERRHDLWGGALRRAFERRRMLGAHDRSLTGRLAWVGGVPVRAVVRRLRRLRRVLVGSVDGRGVPIDVREVRLGVAADSGLLVGGELAPDLRRHAGHERTRGNDRALEHHGAGRDE